MELWDKIKQKTTYRVQISSKKFVDRCIKKLQEMQVLSKAKVVSQVADIKIKNGGITYNENDIHIKDVDNKQEYFPDVLTILEEECAIPFNLCVHILTKSGRLQDFLNNPQSFVEICVETIKDLIAKLEIKGISYIKLDGEEYYVQEVFDSTELIANLSKNAVKVENSIYDYVVYDSATVERPFAVALDNDPDVKLFFKIPETFKIETPIGTYNPDWAVYIDKDGVQKMYFVLETKGSSNELDLREREAFKIHCGEEHFKALDNGVNFEVTSNWKDLKLRF